MSQYYNNLVYLVDKTGTGKWRRIWPQLALDGISQNLQFDVDYTTNIHLDENYYKSLTSVTVQRWMTDQQVSIFCNFIQPIMDQVSGWTIYEIDDLMFDGTFLGTTEQKQNLINKYGDLIQCSIPRFNRGRSVFEGIKVQSNIKKILNTADFITVTTNYLKQFYHDVYDVPLENIIAIPNLLPKYLYGDRYNVQKKVEQFKQNKNRIRVGIVSSLSHYNVDKVREDFHGRSVRKITKSDNTEVWINENNKEIPFSETHEIKDDIQSIINCIKSTIDIIQWVFFGCCPPELEVYVKQGKIEFYPCVSIMHYVSKLDSLNLQAVVVNLNPISFNYCKSFIKTMECAALGIPCFATNCLPYSRVMESNQLFSSCDELKEKLFKLASTSLTNYANLIERQWKWLNSPCDEGDFHINNFWLEDNLQIYIDLYRLKQKCVKVSLNSFVNVREAEEQRAKENTIFKNDNILITK